MFLVTSYRVLPFSCDSVTIIVLSSMAANHPVTNASSKICLLLLAMPCMDLFSCCLHESKQQIFVLSWSSFFYLGPMQAQTSPVGCEDLCPLGTNPAPRRQGIYDIVHSMTYSILI
jgi:hypothetical protein